jgi:hypothetical protein
MPDAGPGNPSSCDSGTPKDRRLLDLGMGPAVTEHEGGSAMNAHDPDVFGRDVLDEVPEADAAEQATPVVAEDGDLDTAADAAPIGTLLDADPADVWEQSLPAAGHGGDDDDGYDHADVDDWDW